MTVRMLSWNVNGIRAIARKGFLDWMAKEDADIVCLQETKAMPEQLNEELVNPPGYHAYFSAAEKKGYSGTVIFSKKKPKKVLHGIGEVRFDSEGRLVITEFRDFVLFNISMVQIYKIGIKIGWFPFAQNAFKDLFRIACMFLFNIHINRSRSDFSI